MNAVEIRGLTKRFGEKTAVAPLDLTIPAGEMFALLGVNGAGKTTVVRMLSCLLAPTAGEAWVNGHSILTEPQLVKASLSASLQETAVAPLLTAEENLRLMAGLTAPDRTAAHRIAEEILEEFGLESVRKSRAGTLSGGWQRRLSIAMALTAQPKILLLDEPTLGLDVLARRELWKKIEARKGNITILLTTHYLEEAEALCDRIGIMTEGQMRAVGTTNQLKAQTGTASLEEAFIKIAEGGTDHAGTDFC